MPDSRIAKSAAVELGNFWATYSAKSPVKPLAPGQVGQVAFARATDVWNRRTCDRSGDSFSTLTRKPAVLPSSVPPISLTLTSASSPAPSVATLVLPSLVG